MRHPRPWAAAALAALLVFGSASSALADPPSGTTPKASDIVGLSGDALGPLLDQFAHDDAASPPFYGFDATNPYTGASLDQITTKSGCAAIQRPLGVNVALGGGGYAGYLEQNIRDGSSYCVDFAGSTRARSSLDPACASGGICFVSLAGDAITYATRDAASGGTDAPASLTATQLAKIYECHDTNWDQVGGSNAPIEAYLPSNETGLYSAWLTALGGGTTPITPGPCINLSLQIAADEGTNSVLDSPDAIVPYSVGAYLAQVYHSAACQNATCTPDASGVICTPAKGQNEFGCNESGVLGLNEITGGGAQAAPATPWPLPANPAKPPVINPDYEPLFRGTVSDVVRYSSTAGEIPPYLAPIFSSTGWICTSAKAKADIEDYGFLPTWKLSTCGAVR
jgi:ABC-type phosphate transport system substrate-binding protein